MPVGQTAIEQAPAAHSITTDGVVTAKGVDQHRECTHRNTVPHCLSTAGSGSFGRGYPAYLGPPLKGEKAG